MKSPPAIIYAIALPVLALACRPNCIRGENLGLKAPPGFRVSLYADETLANDIYAMTLDAKGRVVVTSRGWIKVLHDTKGVGKADKATVFAKTPTGGMGMCFDGNDLYFCGDGWFSRYRDDKGRGEADGPPKQLIPLNFSEHGGHAIRMGPDGWWYVIGGNDSGFDKRHTKPGAFPPGDPEAGAILRISPDGKNCEVIAQGFRNPYDFDFNAQGDLFTYDSDNEEDFFLPWYLPTRLYHIAHGGHHGWRLKGFKRSWGRPDYFADTVDILYPVGRGSPTGVVCYRHNQFPQHYRNGFFALDWTFGKVYFFPLLENGSSYKTKPEVFLESVGTNGFDPTDIVVARDGSLFISMGGRGTRGAVYRIEYVGEGEGKPLPARNPPPDSDLNCVLRAPQPLDTWSRREWVPLATKLGSKPFAEVVANESRPVGERLRAVEVLTERFKGLSAETARAGIKSKSPAVRARIAWSLGRAPCKDYVDILQQLAKDDHPRVRLHALDALFDHVQELQPDQLAGPIKVNLAHPDKRVRQATARLAAQLPNKAWKDLLQSVEKASPQARLTGTLASVWRETDGESETIALDTALSVLGATKDADLRLQALRILMLVLGDFRLKDPPIETYSAYSLSHSLEGKKATVARILLTVRPLFPGGDTKVDAESARLLAMLEDADADLLTRVAAKWTLKSSPTDDMHYLVVFSRLRAKRTKELTAKVADTVLGLNHKLENWQLRIKQNWSVRLPEVVEQLIQRDANLADALLTHASFVNPNHVVLAQRLDPDQRAAAARLFLDAMNKDADFVWSIPLIELLRTLPAQEVRPLLRSQWSNFGLRDAILRSLADKPEVEDRDRFLTGLSSAQQTVIRLCLQALKDLPCDESAKNLIPLLRLLRWLEAEPKEAALRAQALALFERQTNESFPIKDRADMKSVYPILFAWFEKQHADQVPALNGGGEDWTAWSKVLKSVQWEEGEVKRGEAIFRDRACVTCHAGPTRLGPDLAGVTKRFSRDDLFTAILDPSRDVAPAYRVTNIETKKGLTYSGIIAYESAEGVILQTGPTTTIRLTTSEMESRQPSEKSLMPDGLLKDLKAADLADLYAFLRTLK